MIKTLAKSIREYKKQTILSPLYITGEALMECVIPFIMAKLIDNMYSNNMKTIITYSVLLLSASLLSLFFGSACAVTAAKASTGFAKNLRHDLYYKVQDFSFEDVDKFSTSSLITRLTTDVTRLQNSFQMCIRMLFRAPLLLIFSIIMSFTINRKMSLIFVGILPVVIIAFILIARIALPTFRRIFKTYDKMNENVQENVGGIRVVKSFVREEYEKTKFSNTSKQVCDDFTKAEKILAFNQPVMMACIYVAMLLVSYLGAKMIINTGSTELTTGQLSSLISYGIQILSSVMMVGVVMIMLSMSIEAGNRVAEVLNTESTLKSPENGIKTVENGDIDFDDVSFRYAGQSGKDSLSHINLHIKSGQTVGIIGGTGSSKTTLIQLISRLYDVTEGSVRVAGKNVKEYDLNSLRDQVSVVLQKNVLFSGTIKENIRWGKQDATDEEIEHVCKLAQADEFIQNFPDKYDTKIERGGTNVSGGQKQRLCIARALIKHPAILILDDSTSAVDTKTDALIRKAFATEIPNTTKLIIAQRIASVQDADMIIVMDNGEIAETGNHKQLLEKGGIYREVYDSQTKAKEEN